MKTRDYFELAIVTVVLIAVIVFCFIVSIEPPETEAPPVAVVEHHGESIQYDTSETETEIPILKEKLDGSQKPLFSEE